ncbi:hypothetical protein [Paraburkholderia tropica]|uniref:hypothetical protein n=1 Tax=Paraburkholderia tropica TaxID=92647 RepID=UPI002AB6A27E|nr:hypothetical protein [Paraburkholderia tropica]
MSRASIAFPARAALIGCLLAGVYATIGFVHVNTDLKSYSLICLGMLVASCLAVWLSGVAFATVLDRLVPDVPIEALIPIGSALSGFICFASWFCSPQIGIAISIALAIVSGISIASRPAPLARLAPSVGIALMLALFYASIIYGHHSERGGSDLVSRMYYNEADSYIPEFYTQHLIEGRQSLKTQFGDWNSSDRPLLQTGMMVFQYSIARAVSRPSVSLFLGIACNMTWVFGLLGFLRASGLNRFASRYVVIATALLTPMFINGIYTWPKLLAAALALSGGAILLSKVSRPMPTALLLGSAFALAMLAHGAVAFGLIGLLPLWLFNHQLRNLKTVALIAIGAAVLYAPWIVYQKKFDPPGDRLIKWHLAGVVPVTEKPVLQTIVDTYRDVGISGAVSNKIENFAVLTGMTSVGFPHPHGPFDAWGDSSLGRLKQAMMCYVGISPFAALLGVPLMFISRVRRGAWVVPTTSVITLTAIAYCLLEFGGNIQSLAWLHTSPYVLLILWCALGPLAAIHHSKAAAATLLSLIAISFAAFWQLGRTVAADPGFFIGMPDYTMRALQTIIGCALLVIAWRSMVLGHAEG